LEKSTNKALPNIISLCSPKMRITFLLTFAFCCFLSTSFAQNNYSIKGITTDTASFTPLTSAVTVLTAKDSILVTYTYAGNGGVFNIGGLSAGKYLLLITYPDYADYVEIFTLDATHTEHDFGKINMQLKANLLKEVLIRGDVQAIKIKGDTTVFNAKAYVIQPNSKVEDLLKQFPGIEIDSRGKITANGEKINKVLLDGEEFFGDDPTLITRNIRGDMVDKVQLYDAKSKQAAFSGIDDGKKIKTLNVILKEDKKQGVFGKADAGIGSTGYYEGQGIYNRFKAKSKFSVYATAANDGVTALGSADASKANGPATRFDELDNAYSGHGLPVALNAGLHYDDKWNNDKSSVNSNYRAGSLGVTTGQNILSQRTLPVGTLNSNTDAHLYTYYSRQKADALYQFIPDVTTMLQISGEAGVKNTEDRSNSFTTTADGNGVLKNTLNTIQNSTGQDKLASGSLFFTKRLKKAGRTFSVNAGTTYDENYTNSYFNSNVFTASTAKDSVTDQFKPTTTHSLNLSSTTTYTEPVTPTFALTLIYGLSINNNVSDQESYNRSASGRYDLLDTAYSNNYKFDQLSNAGGVNFNYRPNIRTVIRFGTTTSDIVYKQINQSTGAAIQREFTKWEPSASYQYAADGKTVALNYQGSNNEPSITQIQPLKVNTDPTNIILGNPDLRSSFYQSFIFIYRKSEAISNQAFSFSATYFFTTNQIINNTISDYTTGKSTTRYVNLTSDNPFSVIIRFNEHFRSLILGGIHIYTSLIGNESVSYNYINSTLEQSASQTYLASLRVTKIQKSKFTLDIDMEPGFTTSKYLLQPKSNYTAAVFISNNIATVYIAKKIQLNSTLEYQYSGKTPALPATSYALWNGSFSRTFLKDDNLKLSLSANNILDQHRNNRSQNAGIITQNTYNSVQRYFMLSVIWDFTKFGTTASTPVKK
jgi:hypothetical protein